MEESIEKKLRELAEANGVDPDEVVRLAADAALPDGLDAVVEAVVGDVATFGAALSKLDK